MNGNLVKRVAGLLAGAAMLVVLSACGESSAGASRIEAPPSANPTPSAVATPAPAATSIPTATALAPVAVKPTPTPADTTGGDPLALGKLIFDKKAGGVGCAFCHSLDAKGNGPANVNAPDIRTKTEADLRTALQGGVPMMTAMVKLNDDEIAAVMAYIHTLP